MPDLSPATPNPEPTPLLGAERSIDDTVKHAKSGYENAQNVIKLIDAKASILIGLSTLAAGFVISAAKWYIEIDPTKGGASFLAAVAKHPALMRWTALLGVLSLVVGLICIGACVWSVVARSRPEGLQMPFSVLFPIYPQHKEREAADFFRSKLQGMSQAEVLIEYEDQLRVLGLILSKKLKHNRVASVAFLSQLCLLFFTFVLLVAACVF